MQVPNRYYNGADYRYGFQGQEKDNEIKGDGNSINFAFRMHDPRIGRFFSIDPLSAKYPHYSPYSFSGNKVIAFVELEGMEEKWVVKDNTVQYITGPRVGGYHSEDAAKAALARSRAIYHSPSTPMMSQDNRSSEERAADKKQAEFNSRDTAFWKHVYEENPYLMVSHGVLIGSAEVALEATGTKIFDAVADAYQIYRTGNLFGKSRIAKRAIAGFEGMGLSDDFTSALKAEINPSGSKSNCVFCSIEYQKRVMGAVYGSARNTSGYGLTDQQLLAALFENFNDVKTTYAGVNTSQLSGTLNKLTNTNDSAIIVGTLKNQEKFKAHAFNAVRNSDGSWHYMDVQNGVIYNEKAMEKTFSSYRVYDVK